MTDRPGPMRVPTELGVLNTDFWTGGLSGELRIQRCDACSTWHHPPTSRCRACLATTLTGFGSGLSLPSGVPTTWVIPTLGAIASAYNIYCNCLQSGPAGGSGRSGKSLRCC